MAFYKSVQISLIPIQNRGGTYFTDPLWAKDLNACADQREQFSLVAPVHKENKLSLHEIDKRVNVIDLGSLTAPDLENIALDYNLIELPGNFGWAKSSISRRLIKKSRVAGNICILGISSNRAKTTILNAQSKGLLREIVAMIKSIDIRLTQKYLARNVDGVRVVGKGLVPLVKRQAKEVFVETASWVSKTDYELGRDYNIGKLRVAFISRLEPMKGVEIGIRAASSLISSGREISVSVAGDGPERHNLERLAEDLGISDYVKFLGKVAYPDDFFDLVRASDVVALTNLNDEQPRLIFDAISKGAFPICPNTEAYSGMGIDKRLLYDQGQVDSLKAALSRVSDMTPQELVHMGCSLSSALEEYTIENMHAKRDNWYQTLINNG